MKTIDNAVFTKMFLASWKAAKAANAAVAAMAAEAGIGIPDYSLPEKNARLNVLLQLKMNDEAEVPASKKAQKEETPEWITESVKNTENVSVEDSVKEVLAAPLDDLDEELDKFFAEEPEPEPEQKVSPVAKVKAKKVKKTVKKEVKKEAKPALSPYEKIKASIAAKRAELSGSTKEAKEVKPASATPKKVKKAEAKIIKVDSVSESKKAVVSIDGTGKYHDEIDKAIDSVGKDLTIEVPFVMTANGFVRGKAVVAAAIKKGIKNIVVSAAGFDDADKEIRENVTSLVDKLEASGKVSVKFVKPKEAKAVVAKKAAKPVVKTNAPKKGSLLSRISTETETETIALSDISVSDLDMDIIAS